MATAKEVLAQLAALAGENEAVVGANNTTVNKYFGAVGQPYCGYAIWYAVKKAGSSILDGCSNPAYVPTIKAFMESKGWRVSNDQARAGDIFVYSNLHVGFVYEQFSGSTVITLEGNNTAVKKTPDEAKNGTGTAYEGIGYRKLTLTSGYTVYRPAYDGTSSGGTVGPSVKVELNQLSKGSTGAQVKTVQRVLYARGIKDDAGNAISADGQYGAATKAAVIQLQKQLFPNNSAKWDGIVGAETWAAMLTALW